MNTIVAGCKMNRHSNGPIDTIGHNEAIPLNVTLGAGPSPEKEGGREGALGHCRRN